MATGVTFNFSAVTKKLIQLKDRMPKAVARSLNRGAVSARAAMIPAIVADTGLKASKVREAMSIKNATPDRLVTHLQARGARIPLIDFRGKGPEPSRGKPGRVVTAGLKGGAGRYPGAFIARMPANKNAESGHRGIYMRKGTGARMSRGAWSKNLPIRQLYGPSIVHVFTKFHALGIKAGEESIRKNLAHEVSYMLGL
jgi:hypothetical protein